MLKFFRKRRSWRFVRQDITTMPHNEAARLLRSLARAGSANDDCSSPWRSVASRLPRPRCGRPTSVGLRRIARVAASRSVPTPPRCWSRYPTRWSAPSMKRSKKEITHE